jgi:hypothetical protein
VGEPKQPREAWAEVGRQFEELGRVLGEHFSRPDAATWQAASADGGERDDRRRDDRQRVLDALRRAGDTAKQLGDQAGEAVRDPELRESARSATRGLADALETTFSQLADQLRSRTGSSTGSAPGSGSDSWARSADGPQAVVEPVPLDADNPQEAPGPNPDPAPGEDPISPEQGRTRPPSDS